jgi:ankyrin repeat protein
MAEILLDNGADIELRDPDRNTTPLRYAIVYCQRDMIPLLISRGANTGAITDNGTTAKSRRKSNRNTNSDDAVPCANSGNCGT